MKKLIMMALLFVSAPAFAGNLDLGLGRGFSVGISTSLNDAYIHGGYDALNKEAVAGYGKELFPFKKDGIEFAYISLVHSFSAGEAGKGILGVGAGARPVSILNKIGNMCGMVNELVPTQKWSTITSKFLSVEIDYGRRDLFGNKVPDGKRADSLIFGGQISVPVQDFFGLFSK